MSSKVMDTQLCVFVCEFNPLHICIYNVVIEYWTAGNHKSNRPECCHLFVE